MKEASSAGNFKESDFPHVVQLMSQKRRGAVKFPVDAGFRYGKPAVITWTLVPLAGKPEGKRPLERPRHRWEDSIKTDLQEVGCVGYGLDRAGAG